VIFDEVARRPTPSHTVVSFDPSFFLLFPPPNLKPFGYVRERAHSVPLLPTVAVFFFLNPFYEEDWELVDDLLPLTTFSLLPA